MLYVTLTHQLGKPLAKKPLKPNRLCIYFTGYTVNCMHETRSTEKEGERGRDKGECLQRRLVIVVVVVMMMVKKPPRLDNHHHHYPHHNQHIT